MKKPDILIPSERYSNIMGKLYFMNSQTFGVQCASCLYDQQRTFSRDEKGVIIGINIKEEFHSSECKQK